jgi:GNAT superfamily N-acetyltransferase
VSGQRRRDAAPERERPRSVPRIREARPEDVPLLLALFGELAEYEHLQDQLRATPERLRHALFGERPAAEALIAEVDGQPAGYALYFPTFSTFLAIQGIWLEDLFVRPEHRRGGVGRALLAAVAAVLRERGGERLEWSALDWNELALGFYRGLGAQQTSEWITHRLAGADLDRLAQEGAATWRRARQAPAGRREG